MCWFIRIYYWYWVKIFNRKQWYKSNHIDPVDCDIGGFQLRVQCTIEVRVLRTLPNFWCFMVRLCRLPFYWCLLVNLVFSDDKHWGNSNATCQWFATWSKNLFAIKCNAGIYVHAWSVNGFISSKFKSWQSWSPFCEVLCA